MVIASAYKFGQFSQLVVIFSFKCLGFNSFEILVNYMDL